MSLSDPEFLRDAAPVLKSLSDEDKREVGEHIQAAEAQNQANEVTHQLTKLCFKKCITGKITADVLTAGEQSCARNCVARSFEAQKAILMTISAQQSQQQQKASSGRSGFFG